MSMMTARPRRVFTPEFKARTIDLVSTSGKSSGAVCGDLDLTEVGTHLPEEPESPTTKGWVVNLSLM